jgi:hypothetical protein
LTIGNNYKKGTEVTKKLAAYFLSLQNGESIQSIRNISRTMQASLGLISQSIAEIEESGAVSIERRGQLGSFINNISIGKLWLLAVGEPLVISHTLPSNRRYEGLAAAIKQSFSDAGIEIYFIFIRGSRTRIKALRDHRCHIAITSLFAAQGLCQSTESVVLSLPAGSFVSAHQLFTRENTISSDKPLTAAIDPDSYDQMRLSEIEFQGREIEFKKITFMNILHYLSTNQVDMAIWTEDDMQSHLGTAITKHPLSAHTQEAADSTDTQAALIVRSGDSIVRAVIKKVLVPDQLIATQLAIIDGTIIPEY